MANYDLKTETPETAFAPATGLLFGADSQSLGTPAPYTGTAVANGIFGLVSGDVSIAAGGAASVPKVDNTILGGLSPLALGIGGISPSVMARAANKAAVALPTPTIYYDPTATGGTGTGASAANACYTSW